jgi:hypothetical protein
MSAASQPLILVPQQQIPTTSLFYQALLKTVVTFVVKTRGNIPVAAEMRSVFHQYAPGFALDNFQTMQDAVDQNTFSQRLGLYLVGSFAGLAMAMVFAGLVRRAVATGELPRREIGVRMALGATRAKRGATGLRQGSGLVGAGLGLDCARCCGRAPGQRASSTRCSQWIVDWVDGSALHRRWAGTCLVGLGRRRLRWRRRCGLRIAGPRGAGLRSTRPSRLDLPSSRGL